MPPNQARVLRTRLRELLTARGKTSVSRMARDVGIAPNTLRTLLDDDWQQLGRETIERVCDALGLGVHELFELVDLDFWKSFLRSGRYSLLRGSYIERDAKARAIVSDSI